MRSTTTVLTAVKRLSRPIAPCSSHNLALNVQRPLRRHASTLIATTTSSTRSRFGLVLSAASFRSSSTPSNTRGYASNPYEGPSDSTRTRAAVGVSSSTSSMSFLSPPHPASSAPSSIPCQPFTLRAGAIFAVTGLGLYFYFQKEKAKIQAHKEQEHATAKIGRPNIGGPFVLTDQEGKSFSDQDMVGKWSLVYFGFTNCPDICPEELDKMGLVVKAISKSHKIDILPIFITCDPARDNVQAVKAYVQDFIPSLVGLTGTYEDIKKCCKAYRVYFSTPPDAKPTDDYLVDHSIFFYLMDPNGKFVDAFGRSMGPVEVENKIGKYLSLWNQTDGKEGWSDMK
ncbi:BZ3500_MvSof-1268-A1-R1_Chr7-3g09600 [Microbotryum saponariae]|uniref:BZ3500_MvSof-1268-A1-R1_Chr7-3g09600 protein n=1 Tax=Microbotryum saponariae TaxID=289078 RepID=A0A2X0LG14_9BASI|nr:BZ3501_MvSof-1269-A2-R1_Chr7-2g09323 [Microbotryum saponariae]SDA02266.1 BZ3500_MvSof-1268-A1-R1_Chr7-3g09600 [Microbotryum saponariae]